MCLRQRHPGHHQHARTRQRVGACTRVAALSALLLAACADAPPPERTVRVATFNIFELGEHKLDDRDAAGVLRDSQVVAAAEIIRELRPDVLLLNEIDAPPDDPARVARRFAREVLATGPNAIDYPFVYAAHTNTGELSGFDLNRDGVVATAADLGMQAHGDDSWGFGTYPGQYGMAVLSRHPIDTAAVRTFRLFLWRDLPGAHMPDGWFAPEVLPLVRLSSKSHWDVPVLMQGDTLHLLASHPTPPVFDGNEDRNGRRNFDEIGFWARYLEGHPALRDDLGTSGGLRRGAAFVIAGDLNASPDATESWYDGQPAIAQLLRSPHVQAPAGHDGRPTASFLGGTRVDYVLPAAWLQVKDAGVVWPDSLQDPAGASRAHRASDHRLVWVDLALPLRPQ